MCANSEGSGETARMRRLARALAGRLCDKYHNLIFKLAYKYFKPLKYFATLQLMNEWVTLEVVDFDWLIVVHSQIYISITTKPSQV